MNKDIQAIEKATSLYVKQISIAGLMLTVLIIFMFQTPFLAAFRIPMAFLLSIFFIYMIVLAVRIYLVPNTPLPIVPFLGGALFCAGGAGFDGIATLVKNPTLTLEGNPIARSLLAAGFSADLVIFYGVIVQIEFVVFVCILWAAFLKHKEIFLALANSKSGQSQWGFVKAAFGGGHLSWRQFLLPYKLSELPTLYYMFWMIPGMLVGGCLYRWYLGLNWLGLPFFPGIFPVFIIVIASFIGYVIWLWNQYESTPKAKTS